jgi:MGT family glycosyltransferase
MATLGMVCPTTASHLYSAAALGHELAGRGHRVVIFGTPDGEPWARAAGLDFHALGERQFCADTNARWFAELGKLSRHRANVAVERLLEARAAMRLAELPDAVRRLRIDALLVDQSSPEGGTVAERLDLPFVSVCATLLLNRDADVPPFNTDWRYSPARWARLRNRLGYLLLDRITAGSRRIIGEYRQRWNLPPLRRPNDHYSRLAQLCQQPAEFEYPRRHLPRCLHFTGPFESAVSRAAVDFPYQRLSGQPLIYASMGTLHNRIPRVFARIATACAALDAQLVIATGGAPRPRDLDRSVLVVSYAPQLELLSRAALAITHAGLGTVLQCLGRGVPMVAIPVASEQPGLAARIAWSGAGEYVPLARLRAARLRDAVSRVLYQPAYREHALRLRDAIRLAGGVAHAADVVEQVLTTGQPVWGR